MSFPTVDVVKLLLTFGLLVPPLLHKRRFGTTYKSTFKIGGIEIVLPHCRLHFGVEPASVSLGSRLAGQSFSNSFFLSSNSLLFSSLLSSRLTTPLGASCAQKTEAWPLHLESATDGKFSSTFLSLLLFRTFYVESFTDSLGCPVRPKDRGMAAPVMGECHRRYLFSHQSRPLNRYSHWAGPHHHCSSPSLSPSTMHYARSFPLYQARLKLVASPWAFRRPKPSMAAPFGECHWEVRSSPLVLSHLLSRVIEGPCPAWKLHRLQVGQMIQHLCASICPNRTNITAMRLPLFSSRSSTPLGALCAQKTEAWPLRSWESATDGVHQSRLVNRSYCRAGPRHHYDLPALCPVMCRSYALCLLSVSSLAAPISSSWALRCSKPSMAAPEGECHWEVGTTLISALSASVEVDRGPLSLLVSSSSPGGTNDLTNVCIKISQLLYHLQPKPPRLARTLGYHRGIAATPHYGEMRRPRIISFLTIISCNYCTLLA
ncbi:hypothetical protein CVT26_001587 [Gymnopilus dilepis]|uniref:Uncharacterized protein n=1 Tax=Gymnopilus dilepis TaxID=231916 RepID=A0A409VTV2_9AGAR|nr:hypothetical protein CVT26_001587 [Gymnopilus dilepis]